MNVRLVSGGYSVKIETSADPGKNQFADAVSATPVHFDANQVCFPAQPIDATNSTFPTSHYRAALFVRPGNLPLSLAPVAEGFPLFRGHTSEERCVDSVEHIQVCNDGPLDGGVRIRTFDPLVRGRRRTGFDDDRPGEFVRSENELIGSSGGRI